MSDVAHLLSIDDLGENLRSILEWAIHYKQDPDPDYDFKPLDAASLTERKALHATGRGRSFATVPVSRTEGPFLSEALNVGISHEFLLAGYKRPRL